MPLYETAEDLENENRTKIVIEECLKIRLKKLSQTHVMDFLGSDSRYYEVKTRTNTHDKYPTTMVGYNKLEFINTYDKTCCFVFNFTDGIYYYEYDKTKLDELEIKTGWRNDGKSKPKLHAFIPIKYLKKLFKEPTPPSLMGKDIQIYKKEYLNKNIMKINIDEEIDEEIKKDAIELLYSV